MLPHLSAEVDALKVLFIQEEGETIFVPAGWFHAVLNLSTTVCVTQNYASPYDYPRVSQALYSGGGEEGELADEWRVKVTENDMWKVVLSNRQGLHSAIDFCVHCGKKSEGNMCELLDDRPVCLSCEGSALHGAEYLQMSAADVKAEFGLDLMSEAWDEDEVPPCVERPGGEVCFLRSHVLQMTAEQSEEEGEEEVSDGGEI